MGSIRDTYKYELRDRNRVVYIGITNDPERREDEYRAEGKRFSRMWLIGNRTTQAAAERWEEERLASYRRSHRDKNPPLHQQ